MTNKTESRTYFEKRLNNTAFNLAAADIKIGPVTYTSDASSCTQQRGASLRKAGARKGDALNRDAIELQR